MKRKHRILDLFLVVSWGLIVLCGVWIGMRLLDRTPAISPPHPGLTPLPEAVPDNTMTLPQQLSQILQGAFSAEGERSVTLTLSEQQLNELADQTLAEWLGSVQIQLQSGQIAVQIQLHQPDELIRQFPQLGEYGSLLQLAGDSPIRILMQTDEKRKLPLALQQLSVAGLPLPQTLLESVQEALDSQLKAVMGSMEGLSVDKLEIEEDRLSFEGTVPQQLKIEPVPSVQP